jgi:hypothetical protein
VTDKPSALDLWWLADHAHDLADARLRGSSRPWRQAQEDTDPERAAEREWQAFLERAERSGYALGEHPAPMHVDLADLLVELVMLADELAETVARTAGVERMPPASSAFADPRPYLRHAAAHFHGAAEADPEVAAEVAKKAAVMRAKVGAHLGLLLDGQQVPGLCPWCTGGIAGRQTLRVRMVKPSPDLDPVPAAVCESDICAPPDADVGLRHRGRPAWPLDTEGDWLAKRIRHRAQDGPCCPAPKPTEEDAGAVCGEPLLPSGKAGRPRAYCSAECRRAVYAQRKREEREAS